MCVPVWLFRIGHRRCCNYQGCVSTSIHYTHLVVGADDSIPNLQLPLFHLANVEHVAVVHLDILHLELGFPGNRKDTSVVLLSSLFRIEICSIQQDTEGCVARKFGGGCEELRRVVYALDRGFDVIELCQAWSGQRSDRLGITHDTSRSHPSSARLDSLRGQRDRARPA